MEAKTLKKLNKNFDKEWKKLSYSEQKEVVDFMYDTLKETEAYFKIASTKIAENYNIIYNLIDEDTKYELEFLDNIITKVTAKKIAKENKLQEKIMTTNNKQLLYSDIFSAFTGLDKATEEIENIINKSNDIIKNGVNSVSTKSLTSSMTLLKTLSKTYSETKNNTPNQIKKVEELLADYLNTNENENDI